MRMGNSVNAVGRVCETFFNLKNLYIVDKERRRTVGIASSWEFPSCCFLWHDIVFGWCRLVNRCNQNHVASPICFQLDPGPCLSPYNLKYLNFLRGLAVSAPPSLLFPPSNLASQIFSSDFLYMPPALSFPAALTRQLTWFVTSVLSESQNYKKHC